MRGYMMEPEFDDNGEETLKSQIRHEMVEKLAKEWNEYHTKIEQASWVDPMERMDEEDFHAERAKDEAYQAEEDAREKNSTLTDAQAQDIRKKAIEVYYEERRKQERVNHDRIEVIEELLSDLGARMMRPYEHWNEDERYMEYMENRYDY